MPPALLLTCAQLRQSVDGAVLADELREALTSSGGPAYRVMPTPAAATALARQMQEALAVPVSWGLARQSRWRADCEAPQDDAI
jgi:hypothetical protein